MSQSVPLVSVIMPVYNGAEHLDSAIQSVLAQSYENIEIICIDDGSTDTTAKILKRYAQQDARVIILTQQNSGVSAARNRGLNIARGTFVMFVDSDDTVEFDIIQHYLRYVEACIDHILVGQKLDTVFTNSNEFQDFLYRALRHQKLNSPVGKFYRRSVIVDHSIQFPTATSLGEDLSFNLSFVRQANGIRLVPGARYNIREVQGSLTRSFRPSKYNEMMYVQDFLRESLQPALRSKGDSLLNFLRIKALLSCGTSLRQKKPSLTHREIRECLKWMQATNGKLPVRHGDAVMRTIGALYNGLGLVTTQVVVDWFKKIKKSIV